MSLNRAGLGVGLLAALPLLLTGGSALALPRVLVTPVDAQSLPQASADELTEHMIARINAGGRYEAVDVAALNDVSTALAGCKDVACEARLAGVGAVDAIVGATISHLDTGWVVSLYRVEVPSGRIQQRLPEILDGSGGSGIPAALDRLLVELFERPPKLPPYPPRVLLLDVDVQRMNPALSRGWTEIALAEAAALGTHEIKSQRDTRQIVELAECTSGCDDLRREAPIDFVMVLQLARIGSSFVITSKLLQLHGYSAVGRESKTLDEPDEVLPELSRQIRELLALAPKRPQHAPSFIARDPDEMRATQERRKKEAEQRRKKQRRRHRR